jgi:hypothetical protein
VHLQPATLRETLQAPTCKTKLNSSPILDLALVLALTLALALPTSIVRGAAKQGAHLSLSLPTQ